MKLLLVIVSIIAVATVDRTDFPDGREDLDSAAGEPEDHNSAETEHEQKETTLPIQDSIIENDAHHFYSNQTGRIIPRAGNSYSASGHLHSRGSRCKAKDVCIVMGGFCVTNAKLCGGRLVPEGCKGSKCQCCVPATLETMIHNLEQKLQTMQANLTNANLKLNMEFQSMQENLTDANSKLNMEFQSTRDNLTNANSELNMEFQSMRENLTDYISNMRGNLTDANSKLNMEFQSTRDNLTNANSYLNMEFQSMRENLTDANSKFNMEFQSTRDNFTKANSELNMEFQSMRENLTDYISNMRENLTDANSKLNMEFQSTRDNLTNANSYLNMEFQSMRENLTDANSKISMEFQSMRENLTNANLEHNMEFQSMRENLTDSISNIVSKLVTTTVMTTTTEDPTTQSPVTTTVMTTTTEDPTTQSPGCPVGFFNTTGSSQCYRFYNDTLRSWTEAKEMCQTEGYVLPEPTNAISLRKYLVETYGQQTWAYAYLGARGTGSNFRWERSGRQISNSDSLWYPGRPGSTVLTSHCLLMLSSKYYLSRQPNQPYFAQGCTGEYFTVCEYV